MITNFDFGSNLRRIRLKSKFTIKHVHTILHHMNILISMQTIYKWETNLAMPSIQYLNALAYIYNVNLGAFFNDSSQFLPLSPGEETLVTCLHKNRIFKRISHLLIKLMKEVR